MDSALKQINKKTWNYTKAIMVWNVLAFFNSFGVFLCYWLDSHWFFVFFSFLIISIIMAVHSAWLLEEKL